MNMYEEEIMLNGNYKEQYIMNAESVVETLSRVIGSYLRRLRYPWRN